MMNERIYSLFLYGAYTINIGGHFALQGCINFFIKESIPADPRFNIGTAPAAIDQSYRNIQFPEDLPGKIISYCGKASCGFRSTDLPLSANKFVYRLERSIVWYFELPDLWQSSQVDLLFSIVRVP